MDIASRSEKHYWSALNLQFFNCPAGGNSSFNKIYSCIEVYGKTLPASLALCDFSKYSPDGFMVIRHNE